MIKRIEMYVKSGKKNTLGVHSASLQVSLDRNLYKVARPSTEFRVFKTKFIKQKQGIKGIGTI